MADLLLELRSMPNYKLRALSVAAFANAPLLHALRIGLALAGLTGCAVDADPDPSAAAVDGPTGRTVEAIIPRSGPTCPPPAGATLAQNLACGGPDGSCPVTSTEVLRCMPSVPEGSYTFLDPVGNTTRFCTQIHAYAKVNITYTCADGKTYPRTVTHTAGANAQNGDPMANAAGGESCTPYGTYQGSAASVSLNNLETSPNIFTQIVTTPLNLDVRPCAVETDRYLASLPNQKTTLACDIDQSTNYGKTAQSCCLACSAAGYTGGSSLWASYACQYLGFCQNGNSSCSCF